MAEDMRDRRFTNRLNKYYDEVIASIREADSILIFGPGEAKGELEKRLQSEGLKGRIVGIETVDKMTDRQIAAKVRQRFPV
jgi:stalled ribosome rescue protein Dom34